MERYVVDASEATAKLASWTAQLAVYPVTEHALRRVTHALNAGHCSPKLEKDAVDQIVDLVVDARKPMAALRGEFVHISGVSEADARRCLAVVGYSLRWNERLNGIEYSTNDRTWYAMRDEKEAQILSDVQQCCFQFPVVSSKGELSKVQRVSWKRMTWRQYATAAAYRDKVDPFHQWLSERPVWDKYARLESLIDEVFESDSPTALKTWAVKNVMIGAVNRMLRPGTKHDEMVVLVGPQGIGKSTFWSELLPDQKWFSDSLNLAGTDKERVESLLGKVLVECSELRGSTRTYLDSLKAFVSRSVDHIRLAYGHYPQDIPRRCVLVGTTNDEDCLPNDPSGNRRFIPIRVAGKGKGTVTALRKYLRENREQLWAEALDRAADKEPTYLPEELTGVHSTEAARHQNRNLILEEQLDEFLSRRKSPFQLTALFGKLMIQNPTQAQQKEVAGLLKAKGYVRKQRKIEGRACKAWWRDE